MSTTLIGRPPPPATPPAAVRQAVSWRKFLVRPEVGSLVGAIVVFCIFFAIAPPIRSSAPVRVG